MRRTCCEKRNPGYPAAWAQSDSDADRIERIVAVIDAAGIRSRVAGTDVCASTDG
jgi:hypothetical protein